LRSLIRHSTALSYLTPQISMKASNAASASFLVSAIQISWSARLAFDCWLLGSLFQDIGGLVHPTALAARPPIASPRRPRGLGAQRGLRRAEWLRRGALRWVMGESSPKNMPASGMDDVIFAGGGDRPARNMAEVVLFLDNKRPLGTSKLPGSIKHSAGSTKVVKKPAMRSLVNFMARSFWRDAGLLAHRELDGVLGLWCAGASRQCASLILNKR
jgi:hypothetical protein